MGCLVTRQTLCWHELLWQMFSRSLIMWRCTGWRREQLGCHNRAHTADCVWLCSQEGFYLSLEWKLWRLCECVCVCGVPARWHVCPLGENRQGQSKEAGVRRFTASWSTPWRDLCVISAAPAPFCHLCQQTYIWILTATQTGQVGLICRI